jgi:hypothetical protein
MKKLIPLLLIALSSSFTRRIGQALPTHSTRPMIWQEQGRLQRFLATRSAGRRTEAH